MELIQEKCSVDGCDRWGEAVIETWADEQPTGDWAWFCPDHAIAELKA